MQLLLKLKTAVSHFPVTTLLTFFSLLTRPQPSQCSTSDTEDIPAQNNISSHLSPLEVQVTAHRIAHIIGNHHRQPEQLDQPKFFTELENSKTTRTVHAASFTVLSSRNREALKNLPMPSTLRQQMVELKQPFSFADLPTAVTCEV